MKDGPHYCPNCGSTCRGEPRSTEPRVFPPPNRLLINIHEGTVVDADAPTIKVGVVSECRVDVDHHARSYGFPVAGHNLGAREVRVSIDVLMVRPVLEGEK